MDYVTDDVLELTNYLRDVATEKYFLEEQDMEKAFRNTVREFLTT